MQEFETKRHSSSRKRFCVWENSRPGRDLPPDRLASTAHGRAHALGAFWAQGEGDARREGSVFLTQTSGRQLTPLPSPPQNLPFYRIFVADARAPRDGRHIEVVGHYDPVPGATGRKAKKRRQAVLHTTHPTHSTLSPPGNDGHKHVGLNLDRVRYWLGVGAQPSKPVAAILAKAGVAPAPPRAAPTKTIARGVKNPDKPGRVKRET